ncbi:hypothetical protein ACMYR3_06275 [Ampullimonas aquatilis]|uniref:hypothetical protein n=1 Tax=Ampullimonas aquatilis TaxID=1341549 RepID=UPI003C70AC52
MKKLIPWFFVLFYLGMVSLIIGSCTARAAELPANAKIYLPVLNGEIGHYWPAMPMPQLLAGQVEQESCISLTHPKCWTPRAELKTAREYGFGFGQITITSRFDNFKAARGLDASLSAWQWEDRYNPQFQLRTLVLTNLRNYRGIAGAAGQSDQLAMMLNCYNQGAGALIKNRKLCQATQGCDPSRWFGNVETTNYASAKKQSGYGQSFADIASQYPRRVFGRASKYADHFTGHAQL